MPHDQVVIEELARKYLTIPEEEVVQEYLLDNRTSDAKRCLLAKIDLLWDNRDMIDREALLVYQKLGVRPRDCFLQPHPL
ncbi:MAG: hypothetical protein M0P64_00515 [Candidatus Pacebacteria bacterium]|nr:hypothetical protein [Candidatus Paceibacterota bacterium]